MTGQIARLKACINGGRGRDGHPGVPLTPAELAASAAAAVAAGAEAVHLHPRRRDGGESLLAAAGPGPPWLRILVEVSGVPAVWAAAGVTH